MNRELDSDIRTTFLRIVGEVLVIDPEGIDLATPLTDLRADSLDLIEMVRIFEDEYNVRIDDSSLSDVKSLGDALALLAAAVEAGAGSH